MFALLINYAALTSTPGYARVATGLTRGASRESLEESLSFSLLAETGRLELVATDLLSGSLAGTLEGVSRVTLNPLSG
jgi:hypothetical protein